MSSWECTWAEIEREDDVALCAEPCGDVRRRLQLDPVALIVIDRQGEQPESRLARQARRDHGIQAS